MTNAKPEGVPRAPSGRGTALRTNEAITAPDVLLVGPDGTPVGVVSCAEARRRAHAVGRDLVEVDPHAAPPVCRIMDAGPAEERARKRLHPSPPADVRTLRFRAGASETDVRLKTWHGRAFLADGGAVEVRIEIEQGAGSRLQPARDLMDRLLTELSSGTCPKPPTLQDGELCAVLLPRAGTERG